MEFVTEPRVDEERRIRMRKGMIVAVLALLLAFGMAETASAKEIHKTFSGIKAVDLSTVSGDCVIKTHGSSEVIVDVVYEVEPEGAVEFEFKESGKTLVIKEEWGKGKRHNYTSGKIAWTLTVPAETEIEFSTASGDITASGLTGGIDARTASGDIDLRDMKGDLELSTASGDADLVNLDGDIEISTASGDISVENASGDVELSTASGDIDARGLSDNVDLSAASGDIDISDSKAAFDISCASGDIVVKNVVITGESDFSVASGDIEIVLAKTCGFDLELNSASGNVILDYNGNEVKGFFEFTAHKRHGKIVCPIGFDKEEEYEEHGETYLRKSFSKGGDTPRIELSTASGKAVLKK
jgi:DUF4097 and DUF4098 domain-containing protein YvlB